jgi:hypothetical protein
MWGEGCEGMNRRSKGWLIDHARELANVKVDRSSVPS